tara:strand:+ start:371 stop:502 length:132 start_codon:yes stop_codon:yes gene_type:complete
MKKLELVLIVVVVEMKIEEIQHLRRDQKFNPKMSLRKNDLLEM